MKLDKTFSWRRVRASELHLDGKNIIIVGGTGGIGRALSQFYASRGASVTVVGQTFRDTGAPRIAFIKADLSSMRESQRVAATIPVEKADIIIFTTGVMAGPKRETTAEGVENDLAVSYLNRLVMLRTFATRIGVGRPAGAAKARVFLMGFPGSDMVADPTDLNSEKKYVAMTAHGYTVAGNEVLVLDSVKRYPNVDTFGLNPGFVKTNIRAKLFGSNKFLLGLMEGMTAFMTSTPEQYVDRVAPLLVTPDITGRSGAMFDNKARAILPSAKALEGDYQRALIAASEALAARAGAPVS